MYWYNYDKQEYEYLEDTPEDFKPYIPQTPAAQSLYKLLIEHKDLTPIQAAEEVLMAVVGKV